jgi:hypothetical protein
MGFDVLVVKCVKCPNYLRVKHYTDSPSSEDYNVYNCPHDIIYKLDNKVEECDRCHTKVKLTMRLLPTIRPELYIEDSQQPPLDELLL